MGMIQEFKDFAMRGNVVDMAVGIMIGGAFGGIVNSLISDMVMPIIGIFGKADFSSMYFPLSANIAEGASIEVARTQGPVLAYGSFITVVINFIILAFAIFMMVKVMNRLKKAEAAAPPPATPEDVVLLREIRDALKAR